MNILKKYLAPDALKRSMGVVLGRFAVPFVFASLMAVYGICNVYDAFGDTHYAILASALWTLCEGFLLSLVVCLWCDFSGRYKLRRLMLTAVALLVAVDFVAIFVRGGITGEAETIGRASFSAALVAAVLFLPAMRRYSRRQLWSYTLMQVGSLAVAAFIGIVMAISCEIIFSSLSLLFDVRVYRLMLSAMIVLGLWVPCVFYLSRVPDSGDIECGERLSALPVGVFCKNVVLPVSTVYMAILYVYAAKILFTWKLPDGSVTWMVTGLMVTVLLMLYGLQSYTFSGSMAAPGALRIAALVRRWIPVLLLPLLELMSVGLIYRIGEYGITVSRLYVAAFNLWAYCVVFYLILREKANLNIIAASFALVFALVSMIPGLNFVSITYRVLRAEIVETLKANGATTLPIAEPELVEILSGMPRKGAVDLVSKLEYLDDWDDHSRVIDIVTADGDSKLASWRILSDKFLDEDTVICTPAGVLFALDYDHPVEIPEGYTSVQNGRFFREKLNPDSTGYGEMEFNGFKARLNADSLFDIRRGVSPLVLESQASGGSPAAIIVVCDMSVYDDSIASVDDYFIFTNK